MNIQKEIKRTKRKIEKLFDELNDLENSERWLKPFFVPNAHVRNRRLNVLKKEENCIKSKIKLLEIKKSKLVESKEVVLVG